VFSIAAGSSATYNNMPAKRPRRNGQDAGSLGRNAATTILFIMDALSELLRVVRFSGGVFLEAKFRAPWCVPSQVQSVDCGPGVDPGGGMVAFHYVFHGSVQVRVLRP
jgi:Cupin